MPGLVPSTDTAAVVILTVTLAPEISPSFPEIEAEVGVMS